MRLVKAPHILQWFYPKRIWAFPNSGKEVFLTFDDGPHPEITPWVMDLLKTHNAKATFFCIGENVEKHPEIFQQIIAEGHTIGNHTYHHLNGWKTETSTYVNNVQKAQQSIKTHGAIRTPSKIKGDLFRPPYGKMTGRQAALLQKQGYRIVMWDLISYDFDSSLSEEACLNNVLSNFQDGSIVIFHDSLKAEKNLRYTLPRVLEHMRTEGYTLACL